MNSGLMFMYAAYIWFIRALNLTSLPKIYYRLSSETRGISIKELRIFEKNGVKFARRQLDVHYLEYCYDLNLCPQTFKFKIPATKAYSDKNAFYDVALQKQIREAKYGMSEAEKLFLDSKTVLFKKLTLFEKTCLMKLLVEYIAKTSEAIIFNHSRKLHSLWRKQRPSAPDCIVNLSSKKLTIEENEAVRYGLEHNILPLKINVDKIKASIEKATYSAKKKSTEENASCEFKHQVIHAFHSFINSARAVCGCRRNQRKHRTLQKLANDNNIKFCKFDKGSGVCIMDSCDYYVKLESIINDTTKFKKISVPNDPSKHPVTKKYEKVKRYVSNYIKIEHFGEDTVNKLCPGTAPGKLYGMAKIHKPNTPLRPVCSMINTPEYELAKFLDKLIKPHLPSKYMLTSTAHFLDKLKTFNISPGDNMVSFDVISLYTNVPLLETINMITDCLYSKSTPPPFSKTVFKNMMKIATQGYFLFSDSLYQQIDGVIMGSPLGPTLANFFLANLENKLLSIESSQNPALYLRYVDDIFAIFRKGQGHEKFLEILNRYHPSIQFTVEKSTDTLPFLDVEIRLNTNNFDSWVWRKKTHTGLFLNFSAITPKNWKIGLILCMLNRTWDICSTKEFFRNEVEKLKSMFLKNGYPVQFFEKTLEKFICRKNTEKEAKKETEEYGIFIKIPYIGSKSTEFAKKLSKLYEEAFDLKVTPVFTSFKIKNYFSLKSRTPKFLCSNIVYEYKCSCDTNLSYVGVTSRPFHTRIEEHLDVKTKNSEKSAIKKHLNQCQKCFEDTRREGKQYFKILRHCENPL